MLLDYIMNQATIEMNNELKNEVSDEEIKSAVFQLGGSRALGPDGFFGLFYQRNWHIVGRDVITAFESLLRSSVIPSTLIKLI